MAPVYGGSQRWLWDGCTTTGPPTVGGMQDKGVGQGDQRPPLPPALHPRGRRAARQALRRDHPRGIGESTEQPRRADGGTGRVTARGRSARARLLLATRIIAGLVSFSILAGSGYAWASYRNFTSSLTHIDGVPGSSQPGGHDLDGTDQNILLVGDDHRPANASPELLALLSPGRDGGGINTDTMMVLHLPAHGGAPTVISFPRDSWVDIPGAGKGKLNSAFSVGSSNGGGDAGGLRLLIQVIQNMTGLTIDHFVRVSLVGFYDIANVLGPIQVCLNQPAKDSYSGVDLPAGVSTLDAQQALSFVRQRHGLPRGDLDREVRQQYFLSAELHKVISAGTLLNPMKQQQLLSAVGSALQTDPGLDLLTLAGRFQNLSADKVTFTTIPVTGTPTITDSNGNAVSIVAVDFAALPAFIGQVIGRPDPYTQATPAQPDTVPVHVVNATGRPGRAATNATELTRLGFHVDTPTNGTAQAATTITYPAGKEAQAKAVALHIPGTSIATSATVQQVTLTLGSDGRQVGASSTPAAPAPLPGASAPAAPAPADPSSSAPTQAYSATSCID
jgi:LCP family protein required for cell wall assembly